MKNIAIIEYFEKQRGLIRFRPCKSAGLQYPSFREGGGAGSGWVEGRSWLAEKISSEKLTLRRIILILPRSPHRCIPGYLKVNRDLVDYFVDDRMGNKEKKKSS
jgi:hypothetical protein